MPQTERRLTGRDVLAKTFQAKTKRGFDPIEVDAYLELVAAQIDVLHGDIARSGNATQTVAMAPAVTDNTAELLAELEAVRVERDQLRAQLATYAATDEALRAENDQLRSQLTSIAPPPPIAAPDAAVEPIVDDVVAPAAATDHDERASEESLELILRMARKSAEETIAEAHGRADEIIADANLTASQIAKESDRKAYEAANKVQAELASLTAEIETQQGTLGHLRSQANDQRGELRDLAQQILRIADDEPRRYEGAEVVDLREQSSESAV